MFEGRKSLKIARELNFSFPQSADVYWKSCQSAVWLNFECHVHFLAREQQQQEYKRYSQIFPYVRYTSDS